MTTTTRTAPVPFMDLRAQHDELGSEIRDAFEAIVDGSGFIGGPRVAEFERAFAACCGAGEAVGVGSGTDALRVALQAVGVGQGDAVITVAHTFIATVEAVTQIGAAPLFVDIEPGAQTMCPRALERFVEAECERRGDRLVHRASGRRVAAVVPVHLYGQSADMAPILELAARAGFEVVEDACQAHGADYRFPDGRVVPCGAMGRAAAFSFYPGKNLGAMGEAGAITTSDAEVAARSRVLRDHGQSERYVHVTADGSNARLDALQAAVLRLKLDRLGDWNRARRRAAARYRERLAGLPLELPVERGDGTHVYHLFVVRVAERDRVRAALAEAGVQTGLHYPIPLHLQEAYAHLGLGPGSLPETEAAAASVLSLPMFPHLTDAQVDAVAAALAEALGR